MALNLGQIMDSLAEAVSGVAGLSRVYAWPVETIAPPAVVIGYPDTPIEMDVTFGRGSDRLVFPVFLICGNAYTRAARDYLSSYLNDVKDALDVWDVEGIQSSRNSEISIDVIPYNNQDLLTARFEVEVYSK